MGWRPPRSTRTDTLCPYTSLFRSPLAAWMAILFAFPGYRETHALFDDGPNHLHYLVPFSTGWLLRVRPVLFLAVARCWRTAAGIARSEEHTSELQSLMRISYAVFCLKKKTTARLEICNSISTITQ